MPLNQMCQHRTLLNTQSAGVTNCVVITSKMCAYAVFNLREGSQVSLADRSPAGRSF